jgi:hypothetical protein
VFKLLVDTCVWLDLAKDSQQEPLQDVLEELVRRQDVSLILPRTVVTEFARNKRRIAEEGRHSLSGALKRARDAADRLGDRARKRIVLDYLSDIDHKLPSLGEGALESIKRIERLFAAATVIETSETIKLRAAQRAIDGKAPFHRQKNSINDAILIETYSEAVAGAQEKGVRYAFITHNTRDFSAVHVNNKLPHPDIPGYFSRIRSLYFITLGEALRRVGPALMSDIMIEHRWTEQPRRQSEILDAMDLLFHQVWYNRHMVRRERIEAGKTKIVEKETFPVKDHEKRPIQRDVWERALKAAAKVEKKYGLENLGPWDDFEWGMINGKLSALRWVLGDEWDFLDT